MKKLYIKSVIVLIISLITLSNGAIYGQNACWSPFSLQADDPSICKDDGTRLELINTYNAPIISIQWYQYTPPAATPCDDACLNPQQFPASVWGNPVQYGGLDFQTNQLEQTTCYMAVVNTGCCVCRTFIKVCVCDPLDTMGIITTPSPGFPNLQEITGYSGHRACNNWDGKIMLNNYDFELCPTTVTWTLQIAVNDGTSTTTGLTQNLSSTSNIIDTGPLTVPSGMCWRRYRYEATISNACGTKNLLIDIYIDGETDPSDLTLSGTAWTVDWANQMQSSPLEICNDQSAVIKATPGPCDQKIESWWVKPPNGQWTELTNAGQTGIYFTNELETEGIWRYKVKFINGACPGESSVYEIHVKPPLSVEIETNKNFLCPPPATLTATPSYSGVQFTWYHNGGDPMDQTGNPIDVYEPGYYRVEVYDPACYVSAISAPEETIKICSKPVVVIDGPCGICPGQTITITLNAIVAAVPPGCADNVNCTFEWTGPSGFTATSSSIQVTSPGTYTVTATCGTCPSNPASITVEECCYCGSWDTIQVQHGSTSVNVNCPGPGHVSIPVNTTININGNYECDPNTCQVTYTWTIKDFYTGSVIQSGNNFPIVFTTPPTQGEYIAEITPCCGTNQINCQPCEACLIHFKIFN